MVSQYASPVLLAPVSHQPSRTKTHKPLDRLNLPLSKCKNKIVKYDSKKDFSPIIMNDKKYHLYKIKYNWQRNAEALQTILGLPGHMSLAFTCLSILLHVLQIHPSQWQCSPPATTNTFFTSAEAELTLKMNNFHGGAKTFVQSCMTIAFWLSLMMQIMGFNAVHPSDEATVTVLWWRLGDF